MFKTIRFFIEKAPLGLSSRVRVSGRHLCIYTEAPTEPAGETAVGFAAFLLSCSFNLMLIIFHRNKFSILFYHYNKISSIVTENTTHTKLKNQFTFNEYLKAKILISYCQIFSLVFLFVIHKLFLQAVNKMICRGAIRSCTSFSPL